MPLSLTRKEGEEIKIGENILVTVGQIRRGRVRLLIQAPPEIEILRGELTVPPHDRSPYDQSLHPRGVKKKE